VINTTTNQKPLGNEFTSLYSYIISTFFILFDVGLRLTLEFRAHSYHTTQSSFPVRCKSRKSKCSPESCDGGATTGMVLAGIAASNS